MSTEPNRFLDQHILWSFQSMVLPAVDFGSELEMNGRYGRTGSVKNAAATESPNSSMALTAAGRSCVLARAQSSMSIFPPCAGASIRTIRSAPITKPACPNALRDWKRIAPKITSRHVNRPPNLLFHPPTVYGASPQPKLGIVAFGLIVF